MEKLNELIKFVQTKSKKIGLRMFYRKYPEDKKHKKKYSELWDMIKKDLEKECL